MRYKLIFSKRLAIILLAFAIISCVSSRLGSAGESENLGTRKLEGMVFIKGGCFEMGDTFGDGDSDERPVHTVCVDDFYMGQHEVTVGEFRKFADETGYKTEAEKGDGCFYWDGKKWSKDKSISWRAPRFTQNDQYPVVCVSWNDANEYTNWMGKKSGKDFRLPTDAEWEYAARSGGKKEKFAGFSNEGDLSQYANFCDSNCDFDLKTKGQNDGYRNTSPVGSFKPNGLGLYDMSGNVWEWVNDWYDGGYYKSSPKDNPKGPSRGEYRVLRGGSWLNGPRYVRAATRNWVRPDVRDTYDGFRLALSPSVR